MIRPLLAAPAVLLIALPARAEPAQDAATLTYLPSRAAVAVCPAQDFFALEVQIRLGYSLFQPSAPNHLTVKVERVNGLFRSTAEMRDDSGNVTFTRDFSEVECALVLVSMSISVALEFTKPPEDSEPSSPAPPPPPLQPLPPPPCPRPPAPELPPPATAPPPVPDRRRFQAGIGSVFSIGIAPTVVGGVGGFLGVRWPGVSLALEGRALLAPAATIEQASVHDGYHFVFAAVSGTGCYHPAWAFLCVRVEAGNLSFGSSGADVGPSRMSILGLGFRLGGERTLTPWLALRAYVEILEQPVTSVIRDREMGPIIWTQPQLSGSVGLGPVFTFSGI